MGWGAGRVHMLPPMIQRKHPENEVASVEGWLSAKLKRRGGVSACSRKSEPVGSIERDGTGGIV